MNTKHKDWIQYPVTVTWRNGDVDSYGNEARIAYDLMAFSNWDEDVAIVADAAGQRLLLIVDGLKIRTMMPMPNEQDRHSLVRWSDGAILSHGTLMYDAIRESSKLNYYKLVGFPLLLFAVVAWSSQFGEVFYF